MCGWCWRRWKNRRVSVASWAWSRARFRCCPGRVRSWWRAGRRCRTDRRSLQGRKGWNGASEARLAVFRWATRYNTRRRHSRLGQISPITYEQRSTTLATVA
ncbi:integrase core domain-containing protein [Streptomyces sp. NPDC005474]|uniref:integrase core domain-containing protein n=1 Tax=Streptomyces sp. NPDC005474 TaxID=3154878 RepID=UPI0034518B92